MKKILLALVLISFLAVLVMPMAASAEITEAPDTCKIKRDLSGINEACEGSSDNPEDVAIAKYGMCCLVNTLYNITDWLFVILAALATLFVIMGAFSLLTAAGSPESVSKGRNYILYAAIGLAVAFLAKAIPGIVQLIGGF